MQDTTGSPGEVLVGFIGGYLVDSGALTLEQLDRALARQVELAVEGYKVMLGTVLLQENLVTPAQLERALARQQQDLAAVQRRKVKNPGG